MSGLARSPGNGAEGGVATAVSAPPRPTLTLVTDLPAPTAYEVRVFDLETGNRLVAAVEIVSPANKDRPEHRRAFVAKCAALLQEQVSVTIVDLVTTRHFNLYGELLELIGETDPALAPRRRPVRGGLSRDEEGCHLADGNLGARLRGYPERWPAINCTRRNLCTFFEQEGGHGSHGAGFPPEALQDGPDG